MMVIIRENAAEGGRRAARHIAFNEPFSPLSSRYNTVSVVQNCL